jgi:transcriptional regulator with XRE-family HTH domain
MFVPKVGEKIRRARRARDLSQIDVARALGLSQALLSLVERSDYIPERYSTLVNIIAVTGADIESIRRDLIAALPALRNARREFTEELERDLCGKAAPVAS